MENLKSLSLNYFPELEKPIENFENQFIYMPLLVANKLNL